MAIPNPNPNIADGIKSDNKTYSSNKIESLIKTATELPIPEAGDAGKVLTVNSDADGYELDVIPAELPTPEAGDAGKVLTVNAAEDGYELDTPVDPTSIIDDSASSSDSVYSSSKVDNLLSDKEDSSAALKIASVTLSDISISVGAGTVTDICFNTDISSELPDGATLQAIIVETIDPKLGIARSWVTSGNKIAISASNPTTSTVTVTGVTFKAIYI